MRDTTQFSPMMQQYFQIKEETKDCLLFFRLGDFYEMFFEDAITASEELELTLTGRECGQEERAPMCGVPFHSSEAYIARLVAKGYKVAICEQMEDPATAKGLVKRDVVRIVTPGTLLDTSVLTHAENNYLCAICAEERSFGLCVCDVSTGEVQAFSIRDGDYRLMTELQRVAPSELLINHEVRDQKRVIRFIKERLHTVVSDNCEEYFSYPSAEEMVLRQFHAESVAALGFTDSILVRAVGALLHYLHETQKNDLSHINNIQFSQNEQYLRLDLAARRNLELVETLRNKEKRGSLLWVLDKTKTAMGGRLIRQWLDRPLLNIPAIERRQCGVETLVASSIRRTELTQAMVSILDLERLAGRIAYGAATPRDLLAIAQTVERLPEIKAYLYQLESELIEDVNERLDPLGDIRALILRAIDFNAPINPHDGGVIAAGYNETVDELSEIKKNGEVYILRMEEQERARTGIKNLKIRYNRVFGYFIEVTKSYLDLVPDTYIRKQTLAGAERYFTEELKELENTIINAKDRLAGLEYQLFRELCGMLEQHLPRMQRSAHAIAELDVLLSLANVAADNNYCKPKVCESDRCRILDGRHPVVERMLRDTPFVPNDTELDCGENRIAIITGPNMAGKSTYMRQVALITLMAQIGSFVPARQAEIGLVDQIFTRIGASDDLTAGQSTFMVEMSEVADILKNATAQSLILLDEIGRGTSTFDGMSIARAVIEYVANPNNVGAKTLFATHYHELTALEGNLDGAKNYNIMVKKRGMDITFLRKIVQGPADDSYGIEVANLAGVPEPVIARAQEILAQLESGEGTCVPHEIQVIPQEEKALSSAERALLKHIRSLDVNTLTPVETMGLLHELVQEAKRIDA